MYEHSCKKAGAWGCGFKAKAGSEDELRAKVGEHARKVHKVENFTDTLFNYVRSRAGDK